MSVTLRLELKPGFREPLESGAGFVGRDAEVGRLKSIILQRPSATVLVSGHRGVGKTTLVDKALAECATDSVAVARLSLPHIHPKRGIGNADIRGQILRSLARSLHFALKNIPDLDKELAARSLSLYDKSYLKDLQAEGVLTALTASDSGQSRAIATELYVRPGKTVAALMGALGGAVVAAGGLGLASLVATAHGLAAGIVTGTAVLGSAVAAGVTLRKTTTTEKTLTDRIAQQRSSTSIGTFDLSPETLEFELQELLKELREHDLRPVFVIDELDKLERSGTTDLDAHVIFDILASLKNFFTLGAGIYIFISGEDFYAKLEESIASETYSLAHTLFTDRVFVHVLPYEDIETLIDGLLMNRPVEEETYRRFRNFLCWESRNHVFDLLTIVSGYVATYDGETPILLARESNEIDGRWQEGNLPSNWLVAAGLQKIIGATYDEAARPGTKSQRFNQALWLVLSDVGREILTDERVTVPKDGYDIGESRWGQYLTASDLDDLAGAVERFLARSERFGVLEASTSTLVDEEDPSDPGEPAITYTVARHPTYPPASVGTHATPTPFEQQFVSLASELRQLVQNLKLANINLDTLDPVASVLRVADSIDQSRDRKATPKSTVRVAFQDANRLLFELLSDGADLAVQNWAEARGFECAWNPAFGAAQPTTASAASTATGSDLNLCEFETLTPILMQHKIEHAVLYASHNENQVLVLRDANEAGAAALQKAYREASPGRKGQERRQQRLPIVEIRRLPPGKPLDVPEEIIDELDADSGGWLAWAKGLLAGSHQEGATRKVDRLGGWKLFRLDPSGGNVAQLPEVLDQVSYLGPPSE